MALRSSVIRAPCRSIGAALLRISPPRRLRWSTTRAAFARRRCGASTADARRCCVHVASGKPPWSGASRRPWLSRHRRARARNRRRQSRQCWRPRRRIRAARRYPRGAARAPPRSPPRETVTRNRPRGMRSRNRRNFLGARTQAFGVGKVLGAAIERAARRAARSGNALQRRCSHRHGCVRLYSKSTSIVRYLGQR